MRKASKVVTGTKYKSKMDRSFYMKALAVFLLGIVFLAVYFIFHNILVGFLGTWMFVALVGDTGLLIKNGLFDKVTILYRQMMEVTEEKGEARHGSSRVALSKDRIYIRYRIKSKEYWLEISPENKEQFLEEIQEKRIAMPNRKHLAEEAERKETLEESVGQEEIE